MEQLPLSHLCDRTLCLLWLILTLEATPASLMSLASPGCSELLWMQTLSENTRLTHIGLNSILPGCWLLTHYLSHVSFVLVFLYP